MRRLVLIAVAFAVTMTGLVVFARARWLDPAMETGRKLYDHRLRIERQLGALWPPTERHVLVMGDSSIMSVPGAPSWPVLMTRSFAARGVGIVQDVYPGQDVVHHYCVLPAYLERNPDVIVIVVNMRVMFPNRRDGVAMDLCSFLPPAVLARSLGFPWYNRQVSLVRVALMRALAAHSVEDSVMFVAGLRRLFVDRWMAEPVATLSRTALLERWAGYYDQPITPRQPMVRALAALVREAERAGAKTLVVVSPVPLDWLRTLVPVDAGVWRERMRVLRTAVDEAGGTFVDVHALLGPSEFRDTGGHMTADGHARVAAVVGAAVTALLDSPAAPPTPAP